MLALFSKSDRSVMGRWWWTVDRPLLIAMLVLGCVGFGLVMTASPAVATRVGYSAYHYIIRHGVFLVPAFGILLCVSVLPPRHIWRLSTILVPISLLGVVLTLFHGTEVKGAQRWISVFGFSVQPSEFLKPAVIVTIGWLLSLARANGQMAGYALCAALYIVSIGLLLSQPDFGMTMLLTVSLAAQIVVLGIRLRYLFLLGVGGIALSVGAYLTLDHVRSRVDRFLNPETGDTYQIDRSLQAIHNGGLLGTGPGAGEAKLQLPDAHADFIFSVAGEELGLFFLFALIVTYGFIVVRGMLLLRKSHSLFAMLAGSGLLTMLGFQAFIHMGSAIALLPAKGMTLPFISYGGSSLWAVGMTLGMILSLTRGRKNTKTFEFEQYDDQI